MVTIQQVFRGKLRVGILIGLLGLAGWYGATAVYPSLLTSPTPSIAYLSWDANGRLRLYRLEQAGEEPRLLTRFAPEPAADLFDFAVSPTGQQMAYSLVNDLGGSSIWLVDRDGRKNSLLLDCPHAFCTDIVWAPNGRRLVYERRETSAASPYLWWLDLAARETIPVLENNHTPAFGARFATSAPWLSYVSPHEAGVQVYNFANGRHFLTASQIGVPSAWSPSGAALVVADHDLVVLHGGQGEDHLSHAHDFNEAIHLYKVDMATGERTRLTAAFSVDDGVPAWSPDGAWIAFGRKLIRTAVGRQLWLIRADGSEPHALTSDPLQVYGPPAWSPNGRLLLFQRYTPQLRDQKPGVFTLELASSQQTEWAAQGIQPAWLP